MINPSMKLHSIKAPAREVKAIRYNHATVHLSSDFSMPPFEFVWRNTESKFSWQYCFIFYLGPSHCTTLLLHLLSSPTDNSPTASLGLIISFCGGQHSDNLQNNNGIPQGCFPSTIVSLLFVCLYLFHANCFIHCYGCIFLSLKFERRLCL